MVMSVNVCHTEVFDFIEELAVQLGAGAVVTMVVRARARAGICRAIVRQKDNLSVAIIGNWDHFLEPEFI